MTQNTEYIFSVRTAEGISSKFITVKIRVSGVDTGDGTLKSPYLISTRDELYAIGNGSTEHYKLANNIDLKDINRASISASKDNAFKGYFDGNGYTIRNFMVRESKGLFGYTSGATIKNVTLENVDIDVPDREIGSLIGVMDGGVLENCTVSGVGQVKGNGTIGGLVGKTTNNVLIKDCNVTISVIGWLPR